MDDTFSEMIIQSDLRITKRPHIFNIISIFMPCASSWETVCMKESACSLTDKMRQVTYK